MGSKFSSRQKFSDSDLEDALDELESLGYKDRCKNWRLMKAFENHFEEVKVYLFEERRLVKALREGATLDPCPNQNCKRIGKHWKTFDECGHAVCSDCYILEISKTEKVLRMGGRMGMGAELTFMVECPFCQKITKI